MPGEIFTLREENHIWPAPANSFLLADPDGAILIDAGCGWPERYEKIKTFFASHGFTPGDVHTVVLSHAHPDHMGAMPFLLNEAQPRIVIHSLEKPLAMNPELLNDSFDMCHIKKYCMGRLQDTNSEDIDLIDYFSGLCPMGAADATHTVEGGDVLRLARRDFEVIHTPGHAPGHISLYDRSEGLLLSGDVIGEVVAWYCPSGGGASGYLGSLEKIESLKVDLIKPSHGEDITDVRASIQRTRDTILARERAILDILSRGPAGLLDLLEALFPSKAVWMFPGIQITDSHLIKLEKERRIVRDGSGGEPVFTIR